MVAGEDGRTIRARERRAVRRRAILSAATRVFARKGYLGASIRDLIDEAGVARATFYAHFDGKRAVFTEILAETLERLGASIAPVDVDGVIDWREQLIQNLTRCLDVVLEDPSLAKILMLQAEGFDPEFDALVGHFYEEVLTFIGRSLSKGRSLGWIREQDASLQATFVLGVIRQAVIHELGGGRRADRRELAEAILLFVTAGVLRS